ncbi:FliH/SctL family protein [Acetobacter persici]|uniref:Flagellar assembly protein FliH/Type III secretion system HrpE domain-containing protein n=1 Tax=Acetobacter persici TaxID=1076596 RepID=A0A1U9LIU1_9PROT|nr:hypothetical protein [Acetobacter persici]AQT06341.1 hypothetical protein A0U91_15085 [Acetobacter persici]
MSMNQASAGTREPFSSLLTDFREQRSASDSERDGPLDDDFEEVAPELPVEEKFSFTKAELDQIRHEAYANGHKEGFEQAAEQSTEALAGVVRHVVSFLEEEASKGKRILEEVSQTFVDGLTGTVCALISSPEICSSIQRSLASDIIDLISDCDGKISIAVSPLEESALGEAVRGQGDIEILPDQNLQKGQVIFMSGGNKISIDHESWVNQVQRKVLDTVKTAASAS